jgi:hypothetical protein
MTRYRMGSIWRRAFGALAACVVIGGCGGGGGAAPAARASGLMQAPEQVLRPYVWIYSDLDNSEAGFQAQLDYGDPLRVTTLLIQHWTERRDIATTAARLDKVIAKWNLLAPDPRLTYTFAYGRLPAGWWSGMDSWSFPMLLVGLWQETGDARYRTLAERLVATASKPVLEGGTVWRQTSGCWLSEYAWQGMAESDEFYVLNGHLYGLQAIKLMADALHDPALEALYRCGVIATKARSAEFLLGDKWALYMLGPKTINQVHYVIYETMQFDALYALDPDPFFKEQAALRRDLLKRHFPVHIRRQDGKVWLSLSAVGPPHPYAVDTHALEVHCTDGARRTSHALTHPTDTSRPVHEVAMLNVEVDLDPANTLCRVDAEYVGKRFTLYETPARRAPDGVPSPGAAHPYASQAILDALEQPDGSVLVDPARRYGAPTDPDTYLDTQGRLVLTPSSPVPWSVDQLLGFDFESDGQLAIGVTVTSNGREYFRYYPKTRAGARSLILLSPLGFDGGEQISSVERIVIYFYTDQQTVPVRLRPGQLRLFASSVELQAYFRQYMPNFHTE